MKENLRLIFYGKIMILFQLLYEERKIYKFFQIVDVTYLIFIVLILTLKNIFSLIIPNYCYILFIIIAIMLLILESDFFLSLCSNYTDEYFKICYIYFTDDSTTYYDCEKNYKNFKKLRKITLITSLKNFEDTIRIERQLIKLHRWFEQKGEFEFLDI